MKIPFAIKDSMRTVTAEEKAGECVRAGNVLLTSGRFGEALVAFNRSIERFIRVAAYFKSKPR